MAKGQGRDDEDTGSDAGRVSDKGEIHGKGEGGDSWHRHRRETHGK